MAGQLKAGAEALWQANMSAEELFGDYRAAIERANAVLATGRKYPPAALDREPAAWPVDIWPTWQLPDLRPILIHVLTEVGCHAGHLDAARELINGTTWRR